MVLIPTVTSALLQTPSIWPDLSLAILIGAVLLTALILWRRYLSRQMLMRRVAELETLSAAGRAIVASELDVSALAGLISAESARFVDTNTFQVGLFDGDVYRILYWTIDGEQQATPASFDVSDGRGLVNWIRETQKPLLIHDFEREFASLPAKPRYISASPPRSGLFIPLVSGEQTIGLVTAQSKEPNTYQEEDLRRLNILANQAGAALANARLYEQERMRAAHLELVGQIARQVNAMQDRQEIFAQVVSLTRQTFGFHPVSIFDIEATTGDVVLQASSDFDVSPGSARIASQKGLVGTAAATGETIVSNNTAEDARYEPALEAVSGYVSHDSLSEVAIPLIVDDRVLGVLDVQSEYLGAFTASEQTVLEALADEVAAAIHKAQQLAWQQRVAWVTTAQLQIAEAISRSDDLEQIIEAVTRLTPMLTGVPFCGILLWDDEQQVYYGAGLTTARGDEIGRISDVTVAIGDWGALDAVHVGQQPLITENLPLWLDRVARQMPGSPRSVHLLPLTSGAVTQPHGVMIVEEANEDDFFDDQGVRGQRQIDLLINIAQQTGTAVERARLRRAQAEEAWVNTALLQVAEAVNSLIDLNEILDTIVRLLPLLVGVESAVILTRDDEAGRYIPGPSFGVSTMGLGLLSTLEIDDNEYRELIGEANDLRSSGESVHDIRESDWLETVLQSPSLLAISLNAQGKRVGALLVGMTTADRRRLSQRRLNILNGIAQQAATAVVNNQLYKESAERLRLEKEIDVARQIQESFLPSGSPDIPGLTVASYWQAARQVSGDFYDFLPRPDGTWGILIADVADKGVPAALFMALCRTIIRTVGMNRREPAEVLMRVNEIINYDAESDLFVTVFYAVWDPETGVLEYANGGHNPPLLIERKGKHQWVQAHGIALGILPEVYIAGSSLQLHRGDTFIMYTDGVTEAVNADLDEYGTDRLYWTANSVHRQDPETIVTTITESVRDHTGDTPQFDDVTLVVLQRNEL